MTIIFDDQAGITFQMEASMMRKFTLRSFMGLFLVSLFMGPATAADLNLSVAASLTDAVTQISDDFAMKNPGVSLIKNFASSGALAKQIENGAPCDVFISANVKWVDYLKEKQLLDAGSITVFAFNELVFVGSPDLKVNSLKDVARLERVAIGSPKSVPAGEYAMAAITKAGLGAQLENKLVMAKDVRECLMYADRGEVSGAFVYRTDALMARNVKVLLVVPQDLYPRVTYPVALTVSCGKKPEAMAFLRYLQTQDAKKVLAKFGFALK